MSLIPTSTPEAEALDPFTAGVAIFRIFQGMSRRAQTYEDINQAKAEALAQLETEQTIARQNLRTGVLSLKDYVREKERLIQTEQAVIDLTERLKKLTKHQTDRFIGSTILNAALLQLSATSGFIKTVRGIDGFLTSAEDGIKQMLENVSGAAGDLYAQVNTIQDQLAEASALIAAIGGPGGRQLASQLANLEQFIANGVATTQDVEAWVKGELTEALQTVEGLHQDINGMVENVQSWRPGALNLDISKFNDATTMQLVANMDQLHGSRNGQAIISGYAVRSMDRVREAASGANLSLSEEDLLAIASMTGRIYLNERLGPPGRKPAAWEIDLFVWQALNTWLALTGRDPLASTEFAGSWHSPSTCDENEAGFEYRWSVDLEQDASGVVSGTISYHACPGGGRAVYDVTGVATTSRTMRLEAVRNFGAGPLETSSPAHTFITLTPEGAPSRQY